MAIRRQAGAVFALPSRMMSLRLALSIPPMLIVSSSAWLGPTFPAATGWPRYGHFGSIVTPARCHDPCSGKNQLPFGATTRLFSSSKSTTKSYKLEGSGRGTGVRATTNTGHQLLTDIPIAMGGQDEAPQPVELLLGSWMGCTQATASFVARQLLLEKDRLVKSEPGTRRPRRPNREVRLEFDNIQAFRDERGALELPISKTPEVPSRLQRITGTIRVAIVDMDETIYNLDAEELFVLKEQTEARCPIANMMLASGCDIDVDWVQ